MRRYEIAKLFFLMLLLATSGNGQQSSRPFSVAKSLPDQIDPVSFQFSTGKYNYSISHDGKGLRSGTGESPRSFSLQLDRDDHLTRALYYGEYQDDLLLIGEVGDGDYGSGFIVRLDARTLRMKWKQVVSAFNVGQGLVDGGSAYVTGIGFVAKV